MNDDSPRSQNVSLSRCTNVSVYVKILTSDFLILYVPPPSSRMSIIVVLVTVPLSHFCARDPGLTDPRIGPRRLLIETLELIQ